MTGALALLLVACSSPQTEQAAASDEAATAKPVVYVANYPLQYFTQRIAGDLLDVRFPAAGAGDPAYWAPAPAAIAAMQEADLILLNGAGYEQWLKSVSLPGSRVFDSTAGLKEQLIEVKGAVTHSHGAEGEHTHAGTAFTTWLDLSLAAGQARAVAEELSRRFPEQQARFDSRLADLEGDLLALHTQLKDITAAVPETSVVFSHPIYQYLQRAYDIDGHSVHWEPGEMPADMAHDLDHALHDHGAAWVIWEGEPLPAIVEKLEEMGLKSLVFHPLADRPAEGDFLSVMRDNIAALQRVYGKEG